MAYTMVRCQMCHSELDPAALVPTTVECPVCRSEAPPIEIATGHVLGEGWAGIVSLSKTLAPDPEPTDLEPAPEPAPPPPEEPAAEITADHAESHAPNAVCEVCEYLSGEPPLTEPEASETKLGRAAILPSSPR